MSRCVQSLRGRTNRRGDHGIFPCERTGVPESEATVWGSQGSRGYHGHALSDLTDSSRFRRLLLGVCKRFGEAPNSPVGGGLIKGLMAVWSPTGDMRAG
eukprot:220177-Prorocentrum_minimum.AAC.4